MPRSRDVAIFVPMTDDDRLQTKPIALPLAHARGIIIGMANILNLDQILVVINLKHRAMIVA